MVKVRTTPETEIDRLLERIQEKGFDIENQDDMTDAYMNLAELTIDDMNSAKHDLVSRLWAKMEGKLENTMREAKEIKTGKVKPRREIDPDARRLLEQKPKGKRKAKTLVHKFNLLGKSKGRTVFLRKINIKVRGKTVTRYLTKQGKYGSIKRKSK